MTVSGPKQGIMQLEDAMEMATALAQDISTIGAFYHQYQPNIPHKWPRLWRRTSQQSAPFTTNINQISHTYFIWCYVILYGYQQLSMNMIILSVFFSVFFPVSFRFDLRVNAVIWTDAMGTQRYTYDIITSKSLIIHSLINQYSSTTSFIIHHPSSSFINAVVYLGLEASRGIGWNQLLARAEEEKRASAARKRQGTGLAWRIWVKNSQFQWVIVIGLSMDYHHLMDDQSNSNGKFDGLSSFSLWKLTF